MMTLKTRMEKMISTFDNNMGAVIVQKKGQIAYEKYFNRCTANSKLHIFSVTKSIISLLIGIAIDNGYIERIDQKVLDFFPDYHVKRGEQTIQHVTLKHLLTMTAPYKYKSEPYTQYFKSEDWVKASLDLLGGNGKIGEFQYAPVIGPDIFSGILVHTTQQSVFDFASEHLFSPLEIIIKENLIFQNKEEQLAFYEARDIDGWVADPKGVNTGGWGLTLTALEMAKIGQLVLNKGLWNGRQIVSSKWVQESIKKHSQWGKLSYGYLWWVLDEQEHIYAAIGDGGNVIYINANKEIVIVIASFFKPHAKDRIKLIKEYIEPVFIH